MVDAIYGGKHFWVLQADVVLNQANPVSGTQYVVLAETTFVGIRGGAAQCTWTVQPTPLELHHVLDGIDLLSQRVNPASATYYFLAEASWPTGLLQDLIAIDYAERSKGYIFEATTALFIGEVTGGTVQNMTIRLKWSRYL